MSSNQILLKSNDWNGLKSVLNKIDRKEKGDCFEVLTKHYLNLTPKYTTQLKHVWYLREVPAKVRKYLNLPAPDEGIDLVAETVDGEYWAIQCKYHGDETKSITRRELSTFTDLAFNICNHIDLGLVCTSANRFSHKLKLYGERLSFCAGDVWQGLDEEFFKRLHKELRGKSAPIRAYKPRPHQKQAINNAYNHFVKENNSRGKLIQPCGTGKSLIGYWIADKLAVPRILIAVPSLALIKQTLEVWVRESVAQNKNIKWIAICSDESVGAIQKDDAAVLAQDLGIKVHTDIKEITSWLRKHKDEPMAVFTTYQSGKVISAAAKNAELVFDIAIMDEAHKTVGKSDSLFSHLLHDKNIEINKRLFMTATERRYRGVSDQVASMDDYELYGDTFELLSFKEALEFDPPILSDYKIITVAVTDEDIQELVDTNAYVKPDKGKWDKEIESEMLAALVALRKTIKEHRIKHAVSFHSNIARAKSFKESNDVFTNTFPEYGNLKTFHVSGSMPTAIRSQELDEFKSSKRSLVTNARCLTEGVDVPDIDCILFADPKRSTVDIVQAVGRALRPTEGKKFGYVIIPIYIESEQMDSPELMQTAFDKVLSVLKALAGNDERIIEYFCSISKGIRRRGGNAEFQIDIPMGSGIDISKFTESIELRLWSRLAKLAWMPFLEARYFSHNLGFKNAMQWREYCRGVLPDKPKKPDNIPAAPDRSYKNEGWAGWGDWLGTGTISNWKRNYISFQKAQNFARKLELNKQDEWKQYCRGELPDKPMKPDDIPSNPNRTYKNDGWTGWGDWLGTDFIAFVNREYLPFSQAHDFVLKLKLKSGNEWKQYCRGELPNKPKKPENIPVTPNSVYKNDGWISMGDWLGCGTVATQNREYRPFQQAREFVRALGLSKFSEWQQYCRGELPDKPIKPEDIPSNPNLVYKNKDWVSWGDWLGTGFIASVNREYLPYKQARHFVRALGLNSNAEWRQYIHGEILNKKQKPDNIPAKPETVYKNEGWAGWGDWLGSGTVATRKRKHRSYEDAQAFVQKLKLKNEREWREYCRGELPNMQKKPDDIPLSPNKVYKNKGWTGLGDWLGTGTIAPRLRNYLPFSQARAFVRKLRLKSSNEWWQYCRGELPDKPKKPDDIPARPDNSYKNQGWISMGDWLGTDTVQSQKRKYLPFTKARHFVRALGLNGNTEWRQYCRGELDNKQKKPEDIPAKPERTYRDKGWIGYKDWLGTDTKFQKK